MDVPFSTQDLAETQDLLANLLGEVQAQEGTLAGGTKLGIGAGALQALRESNVTFGDPRNNLVRLTPALFEAVKVDLNEIWRQQMESQFDFYYLTLAVSLQPKRGAQFRRITCRLDFQLEGSDGVIVQQLFPTSSWKELLSAGGEFSLALDGSLGWKAGLDLPAASHPANLPVDLQASIANRNTLNAFVTLPRYTFRLGKAEIIATGEGNTFCSWQLDHPQLHETQTATFVVVFKVPKGTTEIQLTGLVVAEPSWEWLRACLRNVFAYLSGSFQALLSRRDEERSPEERLPIGDSEQWPLKLPQ